MRVDTVGDYCNVHKILKNATEVVTLPGQAKNLWTSPRGTLVRIEILVVLASLLFLGLVIFGRRRRRSRNWYIQKGVFGAFVLSSSLVTYTLGLMQSSSVKSSMYSVWAISLFFLHGCNDSITAHSLSDNTQITKQLYQGALYYFYGAFLLSSDHFWTIYATWQCAVIYILLAISLLKFIHRIAARRLAIESWHLNKMVADYMHEEPKISGEIDPVTMEGCRYLVDWPLGKAMLDNETYATKIVAPHNEIIDIKKIWLCKSLDTELKYECLSFSLFHLLRRRVFGFACGESKEKAHDFVFKGLLSDPENDYHRAFKVIEAELSFMYDFNFTKYAAIYYSWMAAAVWNLASVTCICFTIYAIATGVMKYDCNQARQQSYIINTRADVAITLMILASAALIELVQMFVFCTSVWGRVSFACQHVREEENATENRSSRRRACYCCMLTLKVKGLLTNIGMRCDSNKHYWQHQLGQYSLIEAVSKSTCNPWAIIERDLQQAIFDHRRLYAQALGTRSRQASKIRGEQRKPIKLNEQVKKALVLSLVRTQGVLTNGKSSLVVNEAGSFSWACEWDVHPETSCIILTWHIATCYCEMIPPSGGVEEMNSSEFGLATALSRYCAYLVVSEPKLLPGHHYDTSMVFDAVAKETVDFLQRAPNRFDAMKSLMEPPATVFGRGVRLGKQLEEMPEGTRWKVLAEFWAEMLLYAAPSDNVNEHIEKLTSGGEFITHLWALLSHAGILTREAMPQAGQV